MIQELNKVLRWVIIILLISVAVISVYYKYDNCSTCKFEYEGEEINAAEFMVIYDAECLVVRLPLLNENPPRIKKEVGNTR